MKIVFLFSALGFLTLVHCQKSCGAGKECVDAKGCDVYAVESKILRGLTRGTRDYNRQLSKLKALVCNSAERKVCCASTTTPTTTSAPSIGPDAPSYRPSLEEEECGEKGGHAGFIRGGEDSNIGEFPFLALLGKNRKRGPGIFWSCGGTLINKWYVLTAAHCGPKVDYVRLGEYEVVDPNNVKKSEEVFGGCIYYNEVSKKKCEGSAACRRCIRKNPDFDCDKNANGNEVCSEGLQDIPVAEVKIHPQYGKTPVGLAINDIMLLKLSRPVHYNEFVKPVCLPSNRLDAYGEEEAEIFDNNRAVVVGWGSTSTAVDNEIKIVSTARQQKLIAPAVSNLDCIGQYEETVKVNLSGNIKPSQHLCAGGEPGKDSCKGDSGGPLMAREDDISPWQLVGVVSGGTSRCGIGAPGIFTRVTHYDQWIRDNMV